MGKPIELAEEGRGAPVPASNPAGTVTAGRPSKFARKMCLVSRSTSAVFDSPVAIASVLSFGAVMLVVGERIASSSNLSADRHARARSAVVSE
jgi:hypothetical protein